MRHVKGRIYGDNLYWSTPDVEECDANDYISERTLTIASLPDPLLCDTNDNAIDDALKGYIEPILGTFFDLGRGMFHAHLVTYSLKDGGKVEGRADLVFRLHHGIGDGVILSKCLETICDAPESGAGKAAAAEAAKPKRKKKKTNPLYFAWLSLCAVGKVRRSESPTRLY